MSENNQSKRSRCRYCFPSIRKNGNEFHCVVDGWEDENVKSVSRKDCENCDKFSSRYIEYPITVNGIESEEIRPYTLGYECGTLCEVRPCREEYELKASESGSIWINILNGSKVIDAMIIAQAQAELPLWLNVSEIEMKFTQTYNKKHEIKCSWQIRPVKWY